jgi:vacuolar protein sorting-associated protein VTA1
MASPVPEAFKALTSTIRRAEELEKSSVREDRIVAYYCRFYCATKASKITKTPNNDEMKFISEQLTKLEQSKPSLSLSSDEGPRICREYALTIFNKADDVDRAGLSDKGIAKLFYAAGTFFDILEQFGELDKEVSI